MGPKRQALLLTNVLVLTALSQGVLAQQGTTAAGSAESPTSSGKSSNTVPAALASGRPWYAPTAAALAAPSDPAMVPDADVAPDFYLHPGISVRQGWTDNAWLTASHEKSDFITTINPSLRTSAKSRRIDFGLSYDFKYDSYANYSALSGIRHNGLASLNSEVIDQTFYLDARASVSEQDTRPSGATTAGDRTSPGGSTQVITTSISPKFVHQFGSTALAGLTLGHDETANRKSAAADSRTASTTSGLNDTSTNRVKAEVRNGDAFTKLLWDYTSSLSRSAQGNGTVYKQDSHQLALEYKIVDSVGVIATAGEDYVHSPQMDSDKFSGLYYSGGLHLTPSDSAEFRFGVGRRYDQTSLFAMADYKFSPRTTFRFSRDVGVGTDATNAIDSLNTVQRDAMGNYVDPFSGLNANPAQQFFARSNLVYRTETTSAIVRHRADIDTLSLAARMTKRNILSGSNQGQGATTTTANGDILANRSTTIGADFTWQHTLSPVLTSSVTAMISDVTEASSDSAKVLKYGGGLGLTYQMNPTLVSDVNYRVSNTFQPAGYSTSSTVSGRILENAFFASIRKEF